MSNTAQNILKMVSVLYN